MAVNNNFYKTVNELIQRATGGTSAAVVDYKSFVDVGKQLTELSDPSKFMNAFAVEIANKVKLSIDTARNYTGRYRSLIRGEVSANGVIEVITHLFFETRQAQFVKLNNGQTVDQYIINKGAQKVKYYIDDNAYQIPVTIQYTELEGAFQSPEAMDRFLQGKITYAMNTNELAREEGRLGLMAKLIVDLNKAAAATGPETPAQKYELVKMFNKINGTTLKAEDALYNGEFVKFATAMIKKVSSRLSRVSQSYNKSGVKTFTPDTAEDKKIIIHSAFESAMDAYVRQDVRRPEYGVLGANEVVEFWQDEKKPFTVTDNDGETAPVLAVLFDKYAVGEFVCHERVHTTPFNAAGEYYNNWINVQTKYVLNEDANAVLFTLS